MTGFWFPCHGLYTTQKGKKMHVYCDRLIDTKVKLERTSEKVSVSIGKTLVELHIILFSTFDRGEGRLLSALENSDIRKAIHFC